MTIPYADRKTFLEHLWHLPGLPELDRPENLRPVQTVGQPRGHFKSSSPERWTDASAARISTTRAPATPSCARRSKTLSRTTRIRAGFSPRRAGPARIRLSTPGRTVRVALAETAARRRVRLVRGVVGLSPFGTTEPPPFNPFWISSFPCDARLQTGLAKKRQR